MKHSERPAWLFQVQVAKPDPKDQIPMLESAVLALKKRHPVPESAADYLASALAAYLAGQSGDLSKLLGLRPRRGGRYESGIVKRKMAARNAAIRQVAEHLPAKNKANVMAQAIAGDKAVQLDATTLSKIDQLRLEFGDDLPSSARQIGRVINEDTK